MLLAREPGDGNYRHYGRSVAIIVPPTVCNLKVVALPVLATLNPPDVATWHGIVYMQVTGGLFRQVIADQVHVLAL